MSQANETSGSSPTVIGISGLNSWCPSHFLCVISPFQIHRRSWASSRSRAMWRTGKKYPVQKHGKSSTPTPQLILIFKQNAFVGVVSQKWLNLYRLASVSAFGSYSRLHNRWSPVQMQMGSSLPRHQTPAAGGALLFVDWLHGPVWGLSSGGICCWTVPCFPAR